MDPRPGEKVLNFDRTVALLRGWIGSQVSVTLATTAGPEVVVAMVGTLAGPRITIDPETQEPVEIAYGFFEQPETAILLYPQTFEEEQDTAVMSKNRFSRTEGLVMVMGEAVLTVTRLAEPPGQRDPPRSRLRPVERQAEGKPVDE